MIAPTPIHYPETHAGQRQIAFSHFDDIASAVDRGEPVEILRPGKSAL